jgi:hypothetical protein
VEKMNRLRRMLLLAVVGVIALVEMVSVRVEMESAVRGRINAISERDAARAEVQLLTAAIEANRATKSLGKCEIVPRTAPPPRAAPLPPRAESQPPSATPQPSRAEPPPPRAELPPQHAAPTLPHVSPPLLRVASAWAPDPMDFEHPQRCALSHEESSWKPGLVANAARMVEDDALYSRVLFGGNDSREDGADSSGGLCGSGKTNVNISLYPAAYSEYRTCMRLTRAVPATRFCERVVFHSFWGNLPTQDQTAWLIISFLATQDLEFSELWIWSPPGLDVANDTLMLPFRGVNSVHFKVWDVQRESAGTALAARPDIAQAAHDSRYWLDTDLLRILALGKYGGVYVDMDVLLLRNLGPLLGDEWVYQWGLHCTDANGAVMRLHAKSKLFERLLTQLMLTPPVSGSTDWGRGLYTKAAPIMRYPACFFNAAWHTNDAEPRCGYSSLAHRSRWFGAFAYHLHGSVFSLGPKADPSSEYVSAKRELFARLQRRCAAGSSNQRSGAGSLAGLDERLMLALRVNFSAR